MQTQNHHRLRQLHRSDQYNNCSLNRLWQPGPHRNHPPQIGVKLCHVETLGATPLQRICSAPALAEFARPILVSGYGDFVRGFKSSRPDLQRRKCLIQNALRNTEPLATNQRPFFRSTALSDCHKTIYGSLNHIVHMRWGLSIRPRMQRAFAAPSLWQLAVVAIGAGR